MQNVNTLSCIQSFHDWKFAESEIGESVRGEGGELTFLNSSRVLSEFGTTAVQLSLDENVQGGFFAQQ